MQIDYGFNSFQSNAFLNLSRRKQRKVKERVDDSIQRVVAILDGRIELPSRTRVKFIDITLTSATVSGHTLRISTSTIPHALKRNRSFDGVLGHEMSHLSDNRTGNFFAPALPKPIAKLVWEGKAEQLGLMIGGVAYAAEYGTGRATDAVMQDMYIRMHRARRPLGKFANLLMPSNSHNIPANYGVNNSPKDPAYAIGFALVGDAMAQHNTDSVIDIHHLASSAIVDMAIEQWRAGQTRA